MYTINNKFEIGEECFSVYRKPVDYKCPVCEGNGRFMHNGYEVDCKKCNGTGVLHDSRMFLMDICKVRVSRIKATMWPGSMTIKYKVDVIPWDECDLKGLHLNSRSETNLFKTREEAEEYCRKVDTKEITPEF